MIKVTCSSCGKNLKAPDNFAGKQGKCPDCGEVFSISNEISTEKVLDENNEGEGAAASVMKKCPYCAESIKKDAIVCKHCNSEIGQGISGRNTSRQASSTGIPPEINRWNWGAFLLNWIWAIGNRVWIGLLCLVPYVGFVMVFVLGAKGSEWAWKTGRFSSVAEFKRVQRIWRNWGIALLLAIPLLAAMLLPALARARAQAIRADCNRNIRHIVLMCNKYAADNDEIYPSSFEDLKNAGYDIGDFSNCPAAGGNAYGLNTAACFVNSSPDTPLIGDFDSSNHNNQGGNISSVVGRTRWHEGEYGAGSGPLSGVETEDWVRQ